MAVRAMKAGAYDFIEKPYNDAIMLERVQNALAFDADYRRREQRIADIRARLANLTPRETEVMHLVLKSAPNKRIAADLGISIKTVELHRANVMAKMQAASPSELVRLALIAGFD
jgi:FixJ family two-component response regulator